MCKLAFKHKEWIEAINKELDALESNGTWQIIELPYRKKAIGSQWIYKIKYRHNGSVER